MIWLLGFPVIGLAVGMFILAARVENPPAQCPGCGEHHDDPLDDCGGPRTLRSEDLKKRGVGGKA